MRLVDADALKKRLVKCARGGVNLNFGIERIIESFPSAQPTQTNADSTHENTLDCVSRQAAIDALAIGEELLKRVLDDVDVVGNEREKYEWGLGLIEAYIADMKDLPSAQPHWIPCSVRLPEDNVPVNITWINRKPEFYYAEIKDVPFTATGVYFKGKWYWYSSTVEDYLAEYGRAEWDEIEEAMHNSIEVVAWMPLPKPYGGE